MIGRLVQSSKPRPPFALVPPDRPLGSADAHISEDQSKADAAYTLLGGNKRPHLCLCPRTIARPTPLPLVDISCLLCWPCARLQ